MSKERDERESNNVSLPRRGFLKGSGLAMGTALLGSAGLAGCGSNGSSVSGSGSGSGTGSGTGNSTRSVSGIDSAGTDKYCEICCGGVWI